MARRLVFLSLTCFLVQIFLLYVAVTRAQQQQLSPPLVAVVTERKLYGNLGNLDQFLLGYGQNLPQTQVERADEPVKQLPDLPARTTNGQQQVFDQQYPDETRTGTVNLTKQLNTYTIQRRPTNIINRALYRYLKNLNVDTIYQTNLERVNHPKIIDVNVNQLQETYQPRLIVKYARKDIINNVADRNETPIIETQATNEVLPPIFEPAVAQRFGYTGLPLLNGQQPPQSGSLIVVSTDLTPGGNLPTNANLASVFQQTDNAPAGPRGFIQGAGLGGFGSSDSSAPVQTQQTSAGSAQPFNSDVASGRASPGDSLRAYALRSSPPPGSTLSTIPATTNVFQQTNNAPAESSSSFIQGAGLGGFGSGSNALAASQQPASGSAQQIPAFAQLGSQQPGDALRFYAARSVPPPGSTLGPFSIQSQQPAQQQQQQPGDALRFYAARSVPPPGSTLGPFSIQSQQPAQQQQQQPGDALRAFAAFSTPPFGSAFGSLGLPRTRQLPQPTISESDFLRRFSRSHQDSNSNFAADNVTTEPGSSLRAYAARSSAASSNQAVSTDNLGATVGDSLRRYALASAVANVNGDIQAKTLLQPGDSLRVFALSSRRNEPAVRDGDSLRQFAALADNIFQQARAGDSLRKYAFPQ